MAAFSTGKTITGTVSAPQNTATSLTSIIDMANMKSVAVQFTKAGVGSGTAKLQWSINGVTWKDVNTTQNPDATIAVTITAGVTYSLSADNVPGNQARVLFTEGNVAACTFTGVQWLAKLY
jgi:hypothetical protein